MQVSLDKPRSSSTPKVKNILIRSLTLEMMDNNPQCPEESYILKYSPKYYRSLTIEIKPYSPLLSKIKKIKKLKNLLGLTGKSFKEVLPQNLWLNLLANSRKEIEEVPNLQPKTYTTGSFWRRIHLRNLLFFPNLTSVKLSIWNFEDSHPLFIRYLPNMSKLKGLSYYVEAGNYDQAIFIFERLNRMPRFLGSLETLCIYFELDDVNIMDLLQNNENVFSHVTALTLRGTFDPALVVIPPACKNLKSLALGLGEIHEKPEFLDLLASMQQDLKQLKSLKFDWLVEARGFWGHFKPPASLSKLELTMNITHLINEGFLAENAVQHWEQIQELDYFYLNVSYQNPAEAIYVKKFFTNVLKTVRKVHSMHLVNRAQGTIAEPFFVEEIPHLYEHLKKFEYRFLNDFACNKVSAKFDLRMMTVFKNLRELKLEGGSVIYENVEEIIDFMEENQVAPVLEIKVNRMLDQSWLRETLRKIKKRKDVEMLIYVRFFTDGNPAELLEKLCKGIPAGVILKRLTVFLGITNVKGFDGFSVEKVKEVFKKYSEIPRNFKLVLFNGKTTLIYKKSDGKPDFCLVS